MTQDQDERKTPADEFIFIKKLALDALGDIQLRDWPYALLSIERALQAAYARGVKRAEEGDPWGH